ncbi:hypothetical protein EDD85DRAFT_547336 [Armillaria nabsnona]|nr:hypothetical protein EDD85DRAFT_547336 [Armillaria nabsnona]
MDIAQYKKALHPIRRLPPEVLSEIFLQRIDENGVEKEASRFLDATPSRPKSSLDPSQCPWTLSTVCSKCHAISLSFPRLWSNIHLHVRDEKPRKSIRTLNLQLHRSGTQALKVTFSIPPSHYRSPHIVMSAMEGTLFVDSRGLHVSSRPH